MNWRPVDSPNVCKHCLSTFDVRRCRRRRRRRRGCYKHSISQRACVVYVHQFLVYFGGCSMIILAVLLDMWQERISPETSSTPIGMLFVVCAEIYDIFCALFSGGKRAINSNYLAASDMTQFRVRRVRASVTIVSHHNNTYGRIAIYSPVKILRGNLLMPPQPSSTTKTRDWVAWNANRILSGPFSSSSEFYV